MPSLKKLLLFITLPLYILDQWSKWWIVLNFPAPVRDLEGNLHCYAEVKIPGFFSLSRVHNQGVAWGMGNGSDWAPIVFLFVPLIALTLIRVFWKKGLFNNLFSRIAVALLVSGILGNLTDRLTQGFFLEELKGAPFFHRLAAGYVVDFLDFTIPVVNYQWPSFNVADSCICVAATLLFISGLREEKAKERKKAAASA
ncbi:signal peptidase II [Luteolibacter ambystomatis]|uniref:Lipoprotein signal peptidase n=1 Tax=Luteolibacter ambystomatis TaxID=2824561 RepID=A0A975G8R6_9BACT|nr:signal peptidase II [Luteolibacter ambystomatis]QUE50888.1 signal peptidase II [Luteolibacter ambystomatis]